MTKRVSLMVMSGIEDGSLLSFVASEDGQLIGERWTLQIGRREENDICLKSDTFVSREHAKLHWQDDGWWLEDCNSTNGTFIEDHQDFFSDVRVHGKLQVGVEQLFRVGRTWMRIRGEE